MSAICQARDLAGGYRSGDVEMWAQRGVDIELQEAAMVTVHPSDLVGLGAVTPRTD